MLRSLMGVGLAVLAGPGLAFGLGELRKSPALGEAIRLEIELVNTGKGVPADNCFSLTAPAAAPGAMTWVKTARLSVRAGQPAVLVIESEQNLREPILRLGVELGCGSYITREYTVLVSPRKNPKAVEDDAPSRASLLRLGDAGRGELPERDAPRKAAPKPPAPAPVPEAVVPPPAPPVTPPPEKPVEVAPVAAPAVPLPAEAATPVVPPPAPEPAQAAPAPVAPVAPPVPEETADWPLYLGLLVAIAGLLGFLVHRRRQSGQQEDNSLPLPGSYARSERPVDEYGDRQAFTLEEMTSFPDELKPVAKPVVPAAAAAAVAEPVVEAGAPPSPPVVPEPLPALEMPVASPVANADHTDLPPIELTKPAGDFEDTRAVTPVMELAEIMLSFGRVKGAAQALQEFVDNNPNGALQPWIRLLDVYRMAGMREQFEAVARNLNQTFNVELMSWDEMEEAAHAREEAGQPGNLIEFTLGDAPAQPVSVVPTSIRPQSVEDMPRILQGLTERWADDSVIEWMYGLLRDNRGGTRLGFARPVVEELLFLIELCEYRRQLRS